MAKKKRRGKFKKEEWKRIVRFELIGLLLLAITLIAMAGLGAVGQALVLLVRLFIGEWYMLMLIGLLVLAGYIIWKRALPPFITRQLVGTYLIILAILLFSHVTLFENLSKNGTFTDPSVILNTWDLYMLEATGEVNRSDLGGGMVGAVMFAMFYYLFDSLGTELIASLLIVIGVLLITGRSLHETLRKVLTPIVRFLVTELKEGWEDITNWASKKKQRSKGKKKRKLTVEEEEESDEQEVEAPVIAKQPPIIEHFDYEEEADSLPASVQAQPDPQPQPTVKPVQPVEKKESPAQQEEKAPVISFVEAENMEYELPPIRLLTMPKKSNQAKEKKNIYKNAEKLEKTFQSFGVKATVAKVHLGPAVTKYEVYPDVGVKVSKIVNFKR